MPISVESEEQAEALVNTLHIEGATLSDANLSGLTSSDLEQLADLQAELECINSADIETGVEEIHVKQMLDEDIVETEIGEQEVEIEAEEEVIEQPLSPDEILPEIPEQSESLVKIETAADIPPPLRPLNIAPKPVTKPKIPMALKTAAVVNAGTNQQIVLIQSPGAGSTVNIGGQAIKLLSAQGQPVTIPNLQNLQLANKAGGVIQLRTLNKGAVVGQTAETSSVAQAQLKTVTGAVKKIVGQNKNIVTKVIVGGQSNQVVLTSQGNEAVQTPQIKLVSSVASGVIPTTAKTITLAQAQQMGLFSSGKVQHIIPQSPTKQTVVVNKPIQTKTIKVVPQIKSPTKILPAPVQNQKLPTKQGLQRVIIKQGNQLKVASGMNQVIRIPASQGITPGQIHQINVPGKGVQYIRFMTATSTPTTVTTSNTVTVAKNVTQSTQAQKSQVVPVAGITVTRTAPNNKISTVATPATIAQNVIKVVPISSTQTRPVAPKPMASGQRLLIPATTSQARPPQTIATIPASALSQLQGTLIPSGNNVSQIVMLPAQYVQQIQSHSQSQASLAVLSPKVAVTAKSTPQKTAKISPSQAKETSVPAETLRPAAESTNTSRTLEPNGIRPRKPCNCTKSLCLKLYCDCFANGEFCHMCNCMNCYNNLDKEEDRQRAIRNCLERNPNAFRPKIGKGRDAGESTVRKHTKGCNCKRSGCLKNYCECYEAKIACSSNCKCIGCRNIEDSMEKKNIRPLNVSPDTQAQVVPTKSKYNLSMQDITSFRPLLSNASIKVPSSYMTNDVIEATNLCMITVADAAERSMCTEELAQKQILEEFGRCLVQIINCTTNTSSNT